MEGGVFGGKKKVDRRLRFVPNSLTIFGTSAGGGVSAVLPAAEYYRSAGTVFYVSEVVPWWLAKGMRYRQTGRGEVTSYGRQWTKPPRSLSTKAFSFLTLGRRKIRFWFHQFTEDTITYPFSLCLTLKSSKKMEALVCRKLGDPTTPPDSSETTALSISTSHPIPKLNSPTAVRVRIKSTSLNYANYLQVLGKYQEKFALPFVPGSDYSGVVDSVGPNVTKFKVGDPVCSVANIGSFAQFIVAEEKDLYGVPDGCDLVAAGALPVAYGTSHVALIHRANLKSGQVLLVLGAAGGVGLAAVQIGKVCGAIVIAVARGTEKVEILKSMGLDHVVDLSKGGVIENVKAFLKTRKLKGVDVLYDPVGGKLTKESMKLLNWGAQILVIGFASGEVPVIPANIALVKNWTIHGLYWGSYKVHNPSVLEDSLKELLTWLARGLITIYISHSYKLQEANLAFSDIKDRKVIGKVMITFDDPKSINSKL